MFSIRRRTSAHFAGDAMPDFVGIPSAPAARCHTHSPSSNGIEKTQSVTAFFLVGEAGFEPAKSWTTDLQSAPFGRSGIPPYLWLTSRVYHKDLLLSTVLTKKAFAVLLHRFERAEIRGELPFRGRKAHGIYRRENRLCCLHGAYCTREKCICHARTAPIRLYFDRQYDENIKHRKSRAFLLTNSAGSGKIIAK